MICGFAKAINKQKFDIFSEQLAEVIAGGAEILLNYLGGNLGSMSSGGHFFFSSFFLLSPYRLVLAKFQTHTEISALRIKI